jgi:stage V sporulation protein G
MLNGICRRVVKYVEITDIRIKKIANDGKMKAVASVTFDNAFAVHDVKVIDGPEKLFVAMPSRRTPDGEYRDIAHPINSDMRNLLESKVLAAYDAIEDVETTENAEN